LLLEPERMTRQPPERRTTPPPEHYLLEFTIMGRFMRATAIDPITGEEAFVTADPRTPRTQLGRMAVRKLQRQQGFSLTPPPASDEGGWA
jgi:hypothetical protein